MTHVLRRPLVLILALLVVSCGGSDDSTSTTPTATGPTSELFEGKLQGPGDATFYSFTVGTAGNVSVTLASISTSTAPGSSTSIPLGIGLGSPLGTDCNVTQQVTATPGLVTQLTGTNFSPATYCVRVSDVGSVRGPLTFAVRITHT
jgi:hypothetical protein